MQLTWSHEEPFDFAGDFYRVKGGHSDVRGREQIEEGSRWSISKVHGSPAFS
jgi:hypothetical protein